MNIITLRVDASCKMAEVFLNEKLVMRGNFWDFRPEVHGIYQYGAFRGFR